MVTRECDMRCGICWSFGLPPAQSVPVAQKLEMIDIVHADGVRKVIFTGGEPLLEAALPELLRHAKSKGLETWLFTNCMHMRERQAEILPHIDRISISLDGSTARRNRKAHGKGQFERVLDTLAMLRTAEPEFAGVVQVLTVVTRKNKRDLKRIGKLLREQKQGLRFRWKLNFYLPIGRFNRRYQLEYRKFRQWADRTEARFPDIKVYVSPPVHDRAYLFIMPDGAMYTTEGAKYVCLGNIFERSSYEVEALHEIEVNMTKKGRLKRGLPEDGLG